MEKPKEHCLVEQIVLSDFNDLLSVQDLAKVFGVSKQTIYKEIQKGKFGAPIKIGRMIKVPKTRLIKIFS